MTNPRYVIVRVRTVLISSSVWESPGTAVDLTSFEWDARLPPWKRQGEERCRGKLLFDTHASSGTWLLAWVVWWGAEFRPKGGPRKVVFGAPDETEKPFKGFVNWDGKKNRSPEIDTCRVDPFSESVFQQWGPSIWKWELLTNKFTELKRITGLYVPSFLGTRNRRL